MSWNPRRAFVWLVVLLPTVLLGCGEGRDPHGRQALAGAVTLKGQPLDEGFIQFVSKEGNGLSAGASIRAGAYHVPRAQGLPPGVYRVEISSMEKTAPPAGPPGAEPVEPAKERISAEFNVNSRQTIEVRADQDNKFDFAVP